MWWTNSLYTSANEDLGTFAEYDPLTGYEPNDYHITEATEPYIQESSVEHGSPNDFEYDDVTIGKALAVACRRRADHSQEEGLSSSLSSSVSHDRTERPVVCRDISHERYQEIQRHNSEKEQISTVLDRQRERISSRRRTTSTTSSKSSLNSYWNKNRELREAHVQSLSDMEDLKRFQGSTFSLIPVSRYKNCKMKSIA